MKETRIKDVWKEALDEYADYRGTLTEMFREDEFAGHKPAMGYASFTGPNQARGPHEHKFQTDYFVFMGPGNLLLRLWDARKASPTLHRTIDLIVGESNPTKVLVPPGVVHAYRTLGSHGAMVLNFPDKLYAGEGKKEEVDEIRHEGDPTSLYEI